MLIKIRLILGLIVKIYFVKYTSLGYQTCHFFSNSCLVVNCDSKTKRYVWVQPLRYTEYWKSFWKITFTIFIICKEDRIPSQVFLKNFKESGNTWENDFAISISSQIKVKLFIKFISNWMRIRDFFTFLDLIGVENHLGSEKTRVLTVTDWSLGRV